MLLYFVSLVVITGVLVGFVTWLLSLPFLTVNGVRTFFSEFYQFNRGTGSLSTAIVGCLAFSVIWGILYTPLLAALVWSVIRFEPEIAPRSFFWWPQVALPIVTVVITLLAIRWFHGRRSALRSWDRERKRVSGAFVALELIKAIGLVVVNYLVVVIVILAMGFPP